MRTNNQRTKIYNSTGTLMHTVHKLYCNLQPVSLPRWLRRPIQCTCI